MDTDLDGMISKKEMTDYKTKINQPVINSVTPISQSDNTTSSTDSSNTTSVDTSSPTSDNSTTIDNSTSSTDSSAQVDNSTSAVDSTNLPVVDNSTTT